MLSNQPSSQQQHSNAKSSTGLHGVIYQVKLLILFLQTAIDKKYTFELHSEKSNADKFDDVIFKGRDGQYRFLQAKHKSDPQKYKITIDELTKNKKNSSNPFNLNKYFISSCRIEKQPEYEGKVKDLILCTNADFEDNVKKERLTQIKENDDILNDGGKRYKLLFDKNEDIVQKLKNHEKTIQHMNKEGKLPSDSDIEIEIKRFFEKLVFAVEQPDQKKLGELIQKRILNRFDLKDDVQAEFIYDYVEKQIQNWLNEPDSDVLSNENDFFKEGREKIREIMFHSEYSSYIEGLNVNFISECVEIRELNEFLKSENNILNLISLEKNIFISQAKVYQIREQPGWRLETLLNFKKSDNIKAKSLFNNDLLIIICEHECQLKCEDIEELYHELTDSLQEDRNKKIILISQNNSILANFFKKDDLKKNYVEISDNIRIKDLCQNNLQEKLLKKTIVFQGREIRLAHLINGKLNNSDLQEEELQKFKSIIKPETLSELLLNTDIVVGNKLPDFRDPSSPYYDDYYIDITRTYSHQIIEKNSLQKCIKEKREDLFVFPSTIRDYIMRNILDSAEEIEIKDFNKTDSITDKKLFKERFFILGNENPKRDFSELSNNCKGKSVHWLQCIGNDKFTIKYSNNLSNLREFIRKEHLGKKINNSPVVIIVGHAGVGKSTILTECQKQFQKLNPLSWPIRVNLKDHQECIKSANFNTLEGIMEFFYQTKLVGLETALAKSLLEYYLVEYKDQVILLLDGYDEITECNKEKIIHLLKFFENTDRKIWLTTRLSEKYQIEKALETFAFSYFLNPLDEEVQEHFLKQYWIKKLHVEESDQEEKDCIDKFIKKLLKHFHKLGLMKGDGLVGIVLQARMVAEIFHPKSEFNFSEVGISDIPDLYERFIDHQYSRYFTQKINIDINLLGKGTQNAIIDLYTKAYGYLALNTLYSAINVHNKDEDHLCNQQFLTNQVRQIHHKFLSRELNDIGLIKNFNNTSYDADFVHYTYAEYFMAKLSVKFLSKDVKHPKFNLIYKFFLQKLSLGRNKLIRIFLEHEIEKKNDNKIKKNWEMIQHYLGETEMKRGLFSNPSVESNKTKIEIQYDTVSNKTLNDLKKDVQSCMVENPDLYLGRKIDTFEYVFNGDINLLYRLFQKFLKETDIEELKTTLDFIIGVNNIANDFKYLHTNIEVIKNQKYNAIQHYLTQAKLQNKSNTEFEKKIFKLNFGFNESIKNFLHMLNEIEKVRNSPDKIQKMNHLKHLIDVIISEHKSFTDNFRKLNNTIYYLFKVFDQNIVKDINSIESIQKYYKNKILTYLNNSCQILEDKFSEVLKDVDIIYLQSFFIDITHHSNIIADTKLSVNEMFRHQRENIKWLGRDGVLISRFLKILTSEMSEIFISPLNDSKMFISPPDDTRLNDSSPYLVIDIKPYVHGILYDFIIYFIHSLEQEELPQVDKSALLKMIVYFVNIFVQTIYRKYLPFTPNNFKITLKLLENELRQHYAHKCSQEVTLAIKYLCTLKKIGLKIQLSDGKILICGLEEELQLSSNYNIEIMNKLEY